MRKVKSVGNQKAGIAAGLFIGGIMAKEIVLWDSEIEIDEQAILNDYPDAPKDRISWIAQEINDERLYDIRRMTKISLDRPIIVIADLGLWNGQKKGYRVLEKGNISECFRQAMHDRQKYYLDSHNLRALDAHHDGTNYMTFRVMRVGRSQQAFLDKIYSGEVTKADISRYTESLKRYIVRALGL